jgi:hypothetical protein
LVLSVLVDGFELEINGLPHLHVIALKLALLMQLMCFSQKPLVSSGSTSSFINNSGNHTRQ